MKCNYCGKIVSNSSLTCPSCGRLVANDQFNKYKHLEETKRFQKLMEKQINNGNNTDSISSPKEKDYTYIRIYLILGIVILFFIVIIKNSTEAYDSYCTQYPALFVNPVLTP